MSWCWCVHPEQCGDSNSSPRAGFCISAGLSDRRASGPLFPSGIAKAPHLEQVNAAVRAREGKSSAPLLAAQSICMWKRRGPAALDPPKKPQTRALTDQRSKAGRAPSRPVPAGQVPESSPGGPGSVLARPPWGHLPLRRIVVYTGSFKRILIGCITALNDGNSANAILVGVCFFLPFLYVSFFFCFFFVFARSHSALCVDVAQKLSH